VPWHLLALVVIWALVGVVKDSARDAQRCPQGSPNSLRVKIVTPSHTVSLCRYRLRDHLAERGT
jgi:hypothetical protein